MKMLKTTLIISAVMSVMVLTGCSATPSKVTTEKYSKMETNDPCVTKRYECTPQEAADSAAATAAQNERIARLEERQHQAELRETDNRITDGNRVSDLGK